MLDSTVDTTSVRKENGDSNPCLDALERKYGLLLDSLDTDRDGKIDREELLVFIRDAAQRESKMRRIQALLIGLLLFSIMFGVVSFAATWAVVALTEKIKADGTAPGVALVSKSTRETLRTASGMVVVSSLDNNEANAMAVYANADAQTRRRLLEWGNQQYLGDLPLQNALAGCQMLLEGHRDIVTTLPAIDESRDIITKAEIMETSITNCRAAVSSGDVAGLRALLYVEVLESRVVVLCPTSESCHIFNSSTMNFPEQGISGASSRRLMGAYVDGDGFVSLSFGRLGSVLCSQNECRIDRNTRDWTRSRRHLTLSSRCENCWIDCQNCEEVCSKFCSNMTNLYKRNFELSEVGRFECELECYRVDCGSCREGCERYACKEDRFPMPEQQGPTCFPASSGLELENGVSRRMDEIAIGDRVLTVDSSGVVVPSAIYIMPHAQKYGTFVFKRISTDSNHTLTVSPDHYVLMADLRQGGTWVHRRSVPAGRVRVGGMVWVLDRKKNALKHTTVINISNVWDTGIYAPLTLTGTIVVDGIVASVYSTMLGSESMMHSICGFGRYLWLASPQLFKFLHSVGVAAPLSFSVGLVAKALLKLFSVV